MSEWKITLFIPFLNTVLTSPKTFEKQRIEQSVEESLLILFFLSNSKYLQYNSWLCQTTWIIDFLAN